MKFLVFVYLALFLCPPLSADTQEPQFKLVFLTYLFRHGARTPICSVVPNNSWVEEVGYGILTPVGQRMHFTLGMQLRENYKDFIPEEYSYDSIHIHSSNVKRTIESARAQMDGMFFKGGPDIPAAYNSSTSYTLPPINVTVPLTMLSDSALPNKYMPVAIHTEAGFLDEMLSSSSACPKITKLADETGTLENAKFNESYQMFLPQIQELDTAFNFSALHNKTAPSYNDGYCMADWLICSLWNEQELAVKYPSETFYAANFILSSYQYWFFENEYYSRTMATGMLKFFQGQISQKIANLDSPLKMAILSGHDSNIANLMATLNLTNFDCLQEYYKEGLDFDEYCIGNPPFASTFIFEVYQDEISTEDFYVALKINNNYYLLCNDDEAVVGVYCPWETINEVFDSLIVEDYEEVCENYAYEYKQTYKSDALYITIGLAVLEVVLILVLVGCLVVCVKGIKARKANSEEKSLIV